jgi:ankyrin repeat protein
MLTVSREGFPPIFYAVKGNHKEIFGSAIGAFVQSRRSRFKWKYFFTCWCRKWCEEVVKYLVKGGCSVNIQNGSGDTALHLAAKSGSYCCCKILLEAGAD